MVALAEAPLGPRGPDWMRCPLPPEPRDPLKRKRPRPPRPPRSVNVRRPLRGSTLTTFTDLEQNIQLRQEPSPELLTIEAERLTLKSGSDAVGGLKGDETESTTVTQLDIGNRSKLLEDTTHRLGGCTRWKVAHKQLRNRST